MEGIKNSRLSFYYTELERLDHEIRKARSGQWMSGLARGLSHHQIQNRLEGQKRNIERQLEIERKRFQRINGKEGGE